ncbi:MAG: methyltransferase family protein [Gaiellales bacterium]
MSWVIAQLALIGLVIAAGVAFPGSWAQAIPVLGLLLLATGAVLALAGALRLGPDMTPLPTPRSTGRLVETGAYGRARHPIYGGVLLVAIGWSLTRSSWPALAASAALGILLDRKSRHEERLLEQRFTGYAGYRRRTPRRLIPWLY